MFKAQLLGNVGQAPEIKEGKNGKYARLSVASTSGFGEKKRTTWVQVTVWSEKMAEIVEKYVNAGDKIYFEGQPVANAWLKDGEAKSQPGLNVNGFDTMILLGDKSNSSGGSSHSQEPEPEDDLDDDVPF
jgi:single-strand DNA-binding protein